MVQHTELEETPALIQDIEELETDLEENFTEIIFLAKQHITSGPCEVLSKGYKDEVKQLDFLYRQMKITLDNIKCTIEDDEQEDQDNRDLI